jgi:primase-polymerase (primpol)-like protein
VARGSRWAKVPITWDGRPASVSDPRTWASHRAVVDGSPDGRVGFVLGAGVGCVDLDHCLLPSPGGGEPRLNGPARAVLESVPPTFVEVSPSGDGLHVWGLIPEGPASVQPGLEVYSRSRYMTLTGVRWGRGPSRLADLREAVASLL